jgi:HK97 family phage portal protein
LTVIDRIKNALYPETTLSNPEKWLVETFGGDHGINAETALEVTACYACVRLLAEQIAIMPLNLYRNDEKQGRIKQTGHNIHRLLNIEPNPYMSAFIFWLAVMFNKLLTGFGYAEIERDKKTMEPIALWPIPTRYVTKKKNRKGEPVYEVQVDPNDMTKTKTVPYGNMLEIQGITPDGYSVYEPIRLLKNALGLARSAELYSKEYFDNGTHPSGVITYAGALRGEKQDEFRKQIRATYGGLGRHHRVMLMEDGMQFQKISAPPNEGQMYESRKFQVVEIARFFNVPPSKIMDLERATYNNMEEMNAQFADDTLGPYLKNIKQEVMKDLLFDFQKTREGLYVEHDLNSLMRGKQLDRYRAYQTARMNGFLNTNEIREKENMDNIGPAGDKFYMPVNMQPLE